MLWFYANFVVTLLEVELGEIFCACHRNKHHMRAGNIFAGGRLVRRIGEAAGPWALGRRSARRTCVVRPLFLRYLRRLHRMCGSKRSKNGMPRTRGTPLGMTTKAIRADHEPICTVVRANIAHLFTETLASLTFRACLRGWSSSPRNFASSSEMKFSDAPVSASACVQCSPIRVLNSKQSQRRFGRPKMRTTTYGARGQKIRADHLRVYHAVGMERHR